MLAAVALGAGGFAAYWFRKCCLGFALCCFTRRGRNFAVISRSTWESLESLPLKFANLSALDISWSWSWGDAVVDTPCICLVAAIFTRASPDVIFFSVVRGLHGALWLHRADPVNTYCVVFMLRVPRPQKAVQQSTKVWHEICSGGDNCSSC